RGERGEGERTFGLELDLSFSQSQTVIDVDFYSASILLGNPFYLSMNRLQAFLVFTCFFKELLLNQKCPEEGRVEAHSCLFDHLLPPRSLDPLWPFEALFCFLENDGRLWEHAPTGLKPDLMNFEEQAKIF